MLRSVARAIEPAVREGNAERVRPHYLETLTLVERLHRRLLDVIKDEFDRRSRAEINAVQALLLYNIGEKDLTAGDATDARGIISARMCPTTSRSSSRWDTSIISARRSIAAQCASGSPTKGARCATSSIRSTKNTWPPWPRSAAIDGDEFATLNKSLQRLERFWTDQILYRL